MSSDIVDAITSDVLQAYGFTAAGTVGALGVAAWRRLMGTRVEAARTILIEELSRGAKSLDDVPADELAAVTFRYMRAAIEGSARLNLRLLAATASGQAQGAEFYADEFLRWADLIAGLRREEVIVLATLHREWTIFTGPGVHKLGAWEVAQKNLEAEHEMDESSSDAYGTACLRTGLIQMATGTIGGGHVIFPTKLLAEFVVLADIEAVLRRDAEERA